MPQPTAPTVIADLVDAARPRTLLERLRAASDAEVAADFAGSDARDAGLGTVLAALNDSAGWAGPTGVVRVVLVLDSGAVEGRTVRFATTGVSLDPKAEPDVELRAGLVDVVRLIAGQRDGALLYLSGALDVVGDEELVLALGEFLTAYGGRPFVDAAALDPVAVSKAIDGARTEHLASVMAGGFRSLVLREVFGRFPEFLIAEKAVGARVAIAFVVGGRDDEKVDRYVVRVVDGACAVTAEAAEDEKVDATLFLEGHEFLRLVLGHLNPVRGVLSGQIRVKGHVIKALAFHSVMRIPSA